MGKTKATNRLWDKGDKLDSFIHKFTVGNDPEMDQELLPWDILASAAHARMLAASGHIQALELKSLLKALHEAYQIAAEGSFSIPQELEDCHTALEVFLTNKCGEAGKRIHTGRSRNDQVLVATRLLLRSITISICTSLIECVEVCLKKATPSIRDQMPGHTHLQQAMPASVGMWYAAIAESGIELLRDGNSLLDSLENNPLGVASGFYTPLKIDREMTTNALAFKRTQRNPINTQNSRGRYELKVCRFLSDVCALIEKHSWDMIFYSVSEIGIAKIPLAFTTGSSIMPQKRNPDVLELLRAKASKVRACQYELESLIVKLPSNYHRDFQISKEPLLRASNTTEENSLIFTEVLRELEFDTKKLLERKTPELYATYEAFRMVKEGIPFREAYSKTADALSNGQIDVESLSQDFEVIALKLEAEIAEASKEVNEIKSYFQTKNLELNSLSEKLLG